MFYSPLLECGVLVDLCSGEGEGYLSPNCRAGVADGAGAGAGRAGDGGAGGAG